MACPTLSFPSATPPNVYDFGAPYTPMPAGPKIRGRWLDLPGNGTVSFIDATVATASMGNGTQVTIAGNRVTFPAPLAPAVLRAAVFRGGSHVVVASDTVGAPRFVKLAVFPLAAMQSAMELGTYSLPVGVALNLADGMFGQLLLYWHDSSATPPIGKVARVMRTQVRYPGSDMLVTNPNPTGGTNYVFCRIIGSTRTLELRHNATSAGPDSLNTSQSLVLDSREIKAGALQVNPNTLNFGDNVSTRSSVIRNAGNDFLEVLSATFPGAPPPPVNVTVRKGSGTVNLPTCLAPNESLQFDFNRASTNAVATTCTISTAPPSALASEREIVIRAEPTAGVRLLIDPTDRQLAWVTQDNRQKTVSLINQGLVPLQIVVSSVPMGFAWTSTQGQLPDQPRLLNPGTSLILRVAPPPVQASATLSITASVDGVDIIGSPFSIALTSGVPGRIAAGELQIGAWVPDPPGPDILPEGEFIELDNVSGRDLDLSTTRITQRVFTSVTVANPGGGAERNFFMFDATMLNGGSLLPIGRTVRVLTRARNTTDSMADFPSVGPWRVYAGSGAAIWNNTGDTARILCREGTTDIEIAASNYRRSGVPPAGAPAMPGAPATPSMTITLPQHRVPGLSRRIYVDGRAQWGATIQAEDGDMILVRDATGTVTLGTFSGWADPNGQDNNDAPEWFDPPFGNRIYYPMPGARVGALVAHWVQGPQTSLSIFIGKGPTTFRVRDMVNAGGPITVEFSVNDANTGDNGGTFEAQVDVYRT